MSSIQHQIATFISGNSSEYAFPAELSVDDRKIVKMTAEKLGLSSRSFGMGSERQIHIFKHASPTVAALESVEYSVKNTFIDGPVVEEVSVAPAHQSMPVGALQGYIAAEEESLAVILHDSPWNSEADTGSTKDSDSEPLDPPISIKNTFVHFETDSKEHLDPRIVQSMPAGTFADNIQAELEAAAKAGTQKGRPSLLSDDLESEPEASSAVLFPSTPNAENQMSFGAGPGAILPVAQWIPPESSVTILPPAVWAPAPPAPVPAAQGPPPQALTPPMPPQESPQESMQGPLQGSPPSPPPLMPAQGQAYFAPGTPVVLQGLASQPEFNGLRGAVSAFDADCGRYNVMIEIGPNAHKRLVKVKFQNLIPAQPMLVPQPPCCPPTQQPVSMILQAKPSLVLDQMV